MTKTCRKFGKSALAAVLITGLMGGCASDRSVISKATQANDQLAPAIMNDAELSGYMQAIGNRIIAAAKVADAQGVGPNSHVNSKDNSWMFSSRMQFHLVNSKTINAFTTGGEHMYVYNALLQLCDKEDDLAAVMSHEFAHVYSRHVQQGTDRQYAMLGVAGAAGAAGYAFSDKSNQTQNASTAAGLALAVTQFAGLRYTRKDEAQADEFGFVFYSMAGWNPNHFGDFFQKLVDMGADKTPEYMSDHPSLKSRVEFAHQRARSWTSQNGDQGQQPPIATPEQFARIKARAAQLSQSMPDDASLKQAQQLLASFQNCLTPVDQPEQVQARNELLQKAKAQQQQGNTH